MLDPSNPLCRLNCSIYMSLCAFPTTSYANADPGTITCGKQMHKTAPGLASPPVISLASADADAGYTLMMIDPDAPSHASPTFSPIRHWLVVNIAGADLKAGKLGTAQTLSPYHAPGPPTGTGYHRYGQFIFKQKTAQTKFGPVPSSIAKWNYTAFIDDYGLGEKVASNYFLAEA